MPIVARVVKNPSRRMGRTVRHGRPSRRCGTRPTPRALYGAWASTGDRSSTGTMRHDGGSLPRRSASVRFSPRPPPLAEQLLQWQQVQHLASGLEMMPADVRVADGRPQRRMSQNLLDGQQIHIRFQQFRGKRMTQRMGRGRLLQSRSRDRLVAGALDGRTRQRTVRTNSRQQPHSVPMLQPPGAQFGQSCCCQRDQTLLVSLAARDQNGHPSAVDVGDVQMHGFVDAHAGGMDR